MARHRGPVLVDTNVVLECWRVSAWRALSSGYRVETVALTLEPVQSMGGLSILPCRTVAQVDPIDVAAFILPGGDQWEREPPDPGLTALLYELNRGAVPIAAICGATTALAKLGLLAGRRHTSNGLAYLQAQVPDYRESDNYVDVPAVRDRGLITASGLADVEFAGELFAELTVFTDAGRELWTKYFRGGRVPSSP